MKQQNLLPGISLPAPRPSRPAETPPAPSPAAPAVPDTDTWSPQESLLHSAFVFEPAGTAAEPVLILGLDCAQPLREGLAPARLRLIEQADVLCGGRRLLAAFDDLPARQLPLTAPLEPVLARISHLRAGGKKVVVLADGDPLFYGIGTTLLRQLGPEAVRILPGVSSLQQACARLGLPWHDVICLSLHGRDDLTPLHTAVHRQRPISLLTDARMTPDLLARHLLDRGVDWFAMHVFEHMGSDGEQEHHLTLAEAAAARFGAVCTVLLTPAGEMRRPHPGLLPAELRHEDGLLTKPAVRAAALALLRPEPRHTVWDLGAGSGSVALEAACLAHEGRVVAVERTPSRALDIQENRRRFGAASVDVCLGTVPQCLPRLPDPHRVFIGGGLSGDGAHNLLEQVCRRLLPGGRLVVSCILLDTLARCRAFFESLGWPAEVMQIQSAQSRPLGQDIFLAAANPVFLLAVDKPEQKKDED